MIYPASYLPKEPTSTKGKHVQTQSAELTVVDPTDTWQSKP